MLQKYLARLAKLVTKLEKRKTINYSESKIRGGGPVLTSIFHILDVAPLLFGPAVLILVLIRNEGLATRAALGYVLFMTVYLLWSAIKKKKAKV